MIDLPKPCKILDVQVHPLEEKHLVHILTQWAESSTPKKAYYVNVYAMNLASEDRQFRDSLNKADLVFCDGYGVLLASRLLGCTLPERMTPPDWIDGLLEVISQRGKTVFLLGDEPGVAAQCAALMEKKFPWFAPLRSSHGFFDPTGPENESVVRAVRESGASVLLVGMGMPRQEQWIDNNIDRLGISLAIPVGALFRWYTAIDKRAPRWITDHGLEWLARFVRHPARHFKRYAIGNPKFFARLLAYRNTRRD